MAAFEQEGIGALINEWRHYDCLIGQAAKLQLGNKIIHGTIAGINDNGHLLLSQANGEIQSYNSGEVSVDIT